jgi:hypothetical protein
MCQDSDPAAQKIFPENSERMFMACFVASLSGEIWKQTRFQNPQNLQQALTTTFAVRNAVRQEKFAETYTKFEKSVRFSSRGGSGEAGEV